MLNPVALEKLATLKAEYTKVETELAAYGACDPVKIDSEEKRRAIVLAKEASARWTGEYNYLVLLSHFTRQNGIDAADVRAYLGIEEEYEDLDA